MFFSVQFSAENWLQKLRKFSKFFIPIFIFFYDTFLFTYPFPLIWRKIFKCSVLFLFFQLTIHIFLLFFKLLSFRGPILAEIKTLKDFKTEKEFESDWVSTKWRKVFEIKKVDKKKVIQELQMTKISNNKTERLSVPCAS